MRAIIAGVLFTQAAAAAVQTLPFVDHFNYPAGNLYTVASNVWDAGGSSGGELTVQTNAALSGPTGFAASSGNGVKWTPSGTARRNLMQFTSTTAGEIYVSFLLNNITPPGTQRLIAYLENTTSSLSNPQLGIFLNGSTLGVGKRATAPAVTTTIGSGPQLVVVRYRFQSGDDQVDLWVNPTNTSYGAASPPPSLGSTTGATDPANLTYFAFNGTSGSGPTVYYDELRIGTTWADVVPGTPPPPPLTAPAITRVGMTGSDFVIEGVGGTSNALFDVLASTDVTLPVASWAVIGTYSFEGDGSFSVTNPVPDDTDAEFFALRVSGGPTNIPPTISSQPQNQQVLAGQTAQFMVTAAGSLPLWYQWYFNTNTVLNGQTNTLLTIANVSSNDVGGYSVIVSNAAGSVTSVVAFLTLGEPVTNGNWYVSPTGNDNNPGSYNAPFYSLQKAVDLAQPGDVIYLRGGTYPYVNTINIRTNAGTALAPIRVLAYPGERPYFDFSAQPIGDNNRGIHVYTNANYWYFQGLEIGHCGDNAVKLEGSYCTFDQCVFHDNQDTGLQIGFSHTTVNPGTWGAYNTIINCDSYNNYDNATHGGNADGFACKLHPGPGNKFIGCRAWYNSDDGWDLFETDATVIISNCWAWKSGYLPSGPTQGNGNGFKLGGNGTGGNSKGTHYAYNCVAFGCKVNNFTNNSHQDGEVIVNCLAFSPGSSGYNYFFEGSVNAGKTNIFENNAGIPRSGTAGNFTVDAPDVEINNSWNLPVTVSSADFTAITEAAAGAPRQPDGSLPAGFARLVAGSDLIDVGSSAPPYSNAYCGSAPDLGAYEYCP